MNKIARVEGGGRFGMPQRRSTPNGSRGSGIV
jgi:hypothetical protein